VLVPYLGLDGKREVNNYRKIIFENPYLKPGTRVRDSEYALIGYAGLKGRFSSKLTYNIKASYSRIDSMYFYENYTGDTLRNQFIPVYDNVSLMDIGGEFTWHQSDKLQFLVKAGYFKYEMDTLQKAWHKPAFQISCGAGYNIRDKILTTANIFFTGSRYAKGINQDPIEMKPYLDANLAIEYRYTKILSFFLRLNNLTAAKYQIWNQYPVQRFQFLVGFSYAL